jgi:hypothetical protein
MPFLNGAVESLNWLQPLLPPIIAPPNSAAFHESNAAINHRFDVTVAEITQQCECNMCFDNCISSLEVTTKNINQKMDRLLDRFDTSLPSTKIAKTTTNSIRDPTQIPGRPSLLHTNQDPSYHRLNQGVNHLSPFYGNQSQ